MNKLIRLICLITLSIFIVGALFACDNITNFFPRQTEENPEPEKDPEVPIITPSPFDDESLPIPSTVKLEIQTLIAENTSAAPEQISVVCYGIFDNTYCIMTWEPDVGYADVMTEITVGEYTFLFGSSNVMTVYSNGEIYGLTYAYENGILNYAEIEELYSYYTLTHWGELPE